ncbi:hypothetical protein MA16_Dca025055 [Dendrobium catenatum]|uniref:Secreted protein n=1 Tax=Dendrobium catenatum TaxID=906689 RepID=A0A2I0VW10_9ASPA|nr:hypothetical protein MA16_Dca025055 [Dendrobium catenatum]
MFVFLIFLGAILQRLDSVHGDNSSFAPPVTPIPRDLYHSRYLMSFFSTFWLRPKNSLKFCLTKWDIGPSLDLVFLVWVLDENCCVIGLTSRHGSDEGSFVWGSMSKRITQL